MELCLVSGDPDCLRGPIATDRFPLGADVPIELPAYRLRQRADPGYVRSKPRIATSYRTALSTIDMLRSNVDIIIR